jgi:hypothetical protein
MTTLHITEQHALWERIRTYKFEDLIPHSFIDALKEMFGAPHHEGNEALEAFALKFEKSQGWNREYALDVIQEYKKFLFLAVVCDHMVSPAQDIDEVWHQHMLFTRQWPGFCSEVLEYELHHTPDLGIQSQNIGFQDAYRKTYLAYIQHFGLPPTKIWGEIPKNSMITDAVETHKKREEQYQNRSMDSNYASSDGGTYIPQHTSSDDWFWWHHMQINADIHDGGTSGSWSDTNSVIETNTEVHHTETHVTQSDTHSTHNDTHADTSTHTDTPTADSVDAGDSGSDGGGGCGGGCGGGD